MNCPRCQTTNPDEARYCLHCGDQLVSEPLPPSERRRVTVIFADLVGFTAIAEQMDAEHVHRLINSCFDTLVPIIERYGGTIDKFIGDAVMALFGAPITREDDPVRALHAARDMIAAMDDFNAAEGTAFALHIGINSGLVLAGGIGSQGRQRYSVLGDAVNLASRLTAIASANQIVVGAATYRMTEHAFTFEPLEPTQVKGRAEYVQPYRMLEVKAEPGSVRGLGEIRSPMVGRGAELETLLALTGQLPDGRGGAGVLIGEAGIGKSRMLAEWRAVSRQRFEHSGLHWAEGRCLSYGQDLAYHLVRDLLRSLIGVSATASVDDTLNALHGLTGSLLGPAAAEVQAPLAHLLLLQADGLAEGDPQALQAQYLVAMRALLTALAEREPLVLVLDDIHWADPSSVELLIRLLPLVGEIPMLIGATTRPDTDVPGWRFVQATRDLPHHALREVALTPLSAASSRELVANLLHFESLPEALRNLILTKADGNPFFVEEVIRTLIERRAIVQSGDAWIATAEINSLDLPNNVHGLLAGRVDRLPNEHKKLLRVAAAIGRRFAAPVLAEIVGVDQSIVLEQLGSLINSELLRRDQTNPLSFFRFRHALVHEVVYESTLIEERRQLHLSVGQTLEALYPNRLEELAPTLAYHFTLAESEQALEYLLLAGDVSYRQYAVTEAIGHYERAYRDGASARLSCDRLRQFYANFGRALELNGQFERALALYEEMLARAEAEGDQALEQNALIEFARLRIIPSIVRNQDQGRELALRALDLARERRDRAGEARALWVVAFSYGFTAAEDEVLFYGEQALAIARQHNLREQLAYVLHDIHRAYRNRGDMEKSRSYLQEATAIWRELGNLPMLADALNSMADLVSYDSDYERSLRLAQEALRLSKSIGNRWNEAFANAIIGEIYDDYGRVSESLDHFRQSIEAGREAGPVILTMRSQMATARIYLRHGHTAEARRALAAAQTETFPQLDHAFLQAFTLLIANMEAELAMAEGDDAAAERLIRESQRELETSPEIGKFYQVSLRLSDTQLAQRRADWPRVIELSEQVMGMLDHLDGLVGRVIALRYRAEARMQLGDLGGGEQDAQEALTLIEPIRGRRFVWRIQWVLSEIAARRGDSDASQRWGLESYANLQYVIDQINDSDLRTSFQAVPSTQAVLRWRAALASIPS